MKTVFQHIEQVRGKPNHIRKRVAFTAAAVGTSFIALVWLTASLGTGAFALKTTPFADLAGEESLTTSPSAHSGLAGAAAALENDAPARIEIVGSASSTLLGKKPEETTIPF